MIYAHSFRRIVTALLAFGLLFVLSSRALADASILGAKPKYIHLVLDDSGSMADEGKWVSACYAIQSLSAMLNEDDVLMLYLLKGSDAISLAGMTGAERIAQIIQNLPSASNGSTPIYQVKQAANDLNAVSDAYDKWLVVVADGAFDDFDGSNNKSAKLLSEFSKYQPGGNAFRLAYMGIGDDVITIGNEDGELISKGIYPYYATDTRNSLADDGIISKLNKIGNTIFTNYVLNSACTSAANNQLTLNLEMPMEQLIVFAQGINLTLGNTLLSISGASVHGSVVNPSFEELSGCIATFPSSGDGVPAGVYTLSCQAEGFDLSQLMIYARPAVDIGVDLYRDGVALKPGADDLAEGNYTYEAYLIDPQTDKRIPESKQTKDIYNTLTTTITNNGITNTGGITGSLDAQQGTLNILSVAQVPPSNALIQANQGHGISFTIVLEKSPVPAITLRQNGDLISGETISLDSLSQTADDQLAWTITWEDQQTGQTASDALLKRTDYTVIIRNGSDETRFSNTSHGSFSAKHGQLSIEVQAELDNGEISSASEQWTVIVAGSIETLGAPVWKLMDLETNTEYFLEVEATIDDQPLTEEQWKKTELMMKEDGGLDWEVEPGSEVSHWVLRPRYRDGNMLKTAVGDLSVLVTAELADSPFTEARIPFTVLGLTRAEKWKLLFDRYFTISLIGLIVLVIGIGYLPFVKKYFPHMNPMVQNANGHNVMRDGRRLELHWISFLPYAAMKGKINPNMQGQGICPTLDLKADKRRRFYILNDDAFINNRDLLIDGNRLNTKTPHGIPVGAYSTIQIRSNDQLLTDYLFTFNANYHA